MKGQVHDFYGRRRAALGPMSDDWVRLRKAISKQRFSVRQTMLPYVRGPTSGVRRKPGSRRGHNIEDAGVEKAEINSTGLGLSPEGEWQDAPLGIPT
jgi:hypothetical protein